MRHVHLIFSFGFMVLVASFFGCASDAQKVEEVASEASAALLLTWLPRLQIKQLILQRKCRQRRLPQKLKQLLHQLLKVRQLALSVLILVKLG